LAGQLGGRERAGARHERAPTRHKQTIDPAERVPNTRPAAITMEDRSMSKKIMMLAISAAALMAFVALPSMASAFTTTPKITPKGKAFPVALTSTSGAAELITPGQPTVKCTADSNSGSLESSMTGHVKIKFTGCKALGIAPCKSPGAASGTIETKNLGFHLVYLTPAVSPHEKPGILFTPEKAKEEEEEGLFAEFTCEILGSKTTVVVKGNGVLGAITSPGIGGSSTTATVAVNATESGGQEYKDTIEGTVYGLKSSINGGAFGPAFENAGTDTITFAESVTLETE
jgi:hypothetical protein